MVSGGGLWWAEPSPELGAPWRSRVGSPVQTLKNWMSEHGWRSPSPWVWRHSMSQKVLDFSQVSFDLSYARHCLRSHWRLWCFDNFLQCQRREVIDCSQVDLSTFESVDWEGIRKFADSSAAGRAVAVGASWSPASLHDRLDQDTSCPWCGSLGTWFHVAWGCEFSPLKDIRPVTPVSGISRRFGRSSDLDVLYYLASVQSLLWAKKYGS